MIGLRGPYIVLAQILPSLSQAQGHRGIVVFAID